MLKMTRLEQCMYDRRNRTPLVEALSFKEKVHAVRTEGFNRITARARDEYNGQNHIPAPILNDMIERIDPQPHHRIAVFDRITGVILDLLGCKDITLFDRGEGFLLSNTKFDVIIGNPPYQESKVDGSRKDQASNLWSKFWSHSLRHTTHQGHVALITPTSWLSPSADLRGADKHDGLDRLWDIFDQYDSLARVHDVQRHFPGVGSSFGYVIVNKGGTGGLRFADGSDTSLGFLPRSGHDEVRRHLSTTSNLGQLFRIDQVNSADLRVAIPMTRVLAAHTIEILEGAAQPTGGAQDDKLYLYVHVDTPQQAAQVKAAVEGCLSTLNTHCRWNGFINIRVVKMIALQVDAPPQDRL